MARKVSKNRYYYSGGVHLSRYICLHISSRKFPRAFSFSSVLTNNSISMDATRLSNQLIWNIAEGAAVSTGRRYLIIKHLAFCGEIFPGSR